MKLHSIKIEGFRRHFQTEILCSDATFLIGPNNVGKSSILKAIEYLLSDTQKMPDEDFFSILGEDNNNKILCDKVVITSEFRDIPPNAYKWKGFNKQRMFKYESHDENESGYRIFYRKTYFLGNNKCKIEMLQYNSFLKEKFKECNSIQDYINYGLSEEVVKELFPDKKYNQKMTENMLKVLEDNGVEEVFEIDENEIKWFENPGGIAGNVLHRLPRFLLISDKPNNDELSGKNGALIKTLTQLFEDVRDKSENFKNVQYYLEELAKELDPNDESSDFAQLLSGLNKVLGEVFPNTTFLARANLSNAGDVIKPNFDVELGSNIHTSIDYQGAGVIRSAIFAMLRYRSMRENKLTREEYIRPLLIAFEEPEIYLHPQAAKQMRDIIYELAMDKNNQIICTTHSPYMIDLSKNTHQVLNSLYLDYDRVELNDSKRNLEVVHSNPFNVSEAYKSLIEDEKTYIKMLLKIDDSITKVFFTKKVLIVEGDTEEVVIRETVARMPEDMYKDFSYNWEVVKARGKAAIIPLVKYFNALGIYPYVIHDRDGGIEKAFNFNKSILDAVGDPNRVFLIKECMEDLLGYKSSSSDKPYKAYHFINSNWGKKWEDINPEWRGIIEQIIYGKKENNTSYIEVAATKDEN